MQHIVKPMLRHPTMPILMMIQVAIACAIACNALFLLQQKLVPVMASDGIGNPARLMVVNNLYAHGKPWGPARLRAVQAELRALPGVKAVSYAATFPMTSTGRMSARVRSSDRKNDVMTSIYLGDNLLKTLDLHLIAGRNFSTAEESTIVGSGMGFIMPAQPSLREHWRTVCFQTSTPWGRRSCTNTSATAHGPWSASLPT